MARIIIDLAPGCRPVEPMTNSWEEGGVVVLMIAKEDLPLDKAYQLIVDQVAALRGLADAIERANVEVETETQVAALQPSMFGPKETAQG